LIFIDCVYNNNLTRSIGAVTVFEIIPANPPEKKSKRKFVTEGESGEG